MKNVKGAWCKVLGLVIFMFLIHTGCYAQKPDPNAWDFGKIKQGEVVSHSFSLKNESGKTLKITGMNTSCGCAVSEIKQKTLLPGESTLVDVKFHSKGYSGAIQQFVYVNTDDIDNPVIRFIIKAEVVK